MELYNKLFFCYTTVGYAQQRYNYVVVWVEKHNKIIFSLCISNCCTTDK